MDSEKAAKVGLVDYGDAAYDDDFDDEIDKVRLMGDGAKPGHEACARKPQNWLLVGDKW